MNPAHSALVLSLGVFVGMLACLEVGYRLGTRLPGKHPDLGHEGTGAIEAAVFALLGLLLGFSFAGGTSRLDAKHQLVIQEANAIGTAYLRLDLLPTNYQSEMRSLFRQYLDTRLSVYQTLPDIQAAEREMGVAEQLQKRIWSRAVNAGRDDPSQNVARLLLPSLNEMIDITTARTIALQTHLPALIFFLLIAVALLSSLVAGYAMAKRRSRSWLHMLIYAGVISITIYAVLDLDYPRFGLVRVNAADQALVQLRDSIQAQAKAGTVDNRVDTWMGRWMGPEGTYLDLSKRDAGYVVTVRSLDGLQTYQGSATDGRIEFVRNGRTESIRAGNGQQTGMKWLLEKNQCLIIKTGEGFCRD